MKRGFSGFYCARPNFTGKDCFEVRYQNFMVGIGENQEISKRREKAKG